MMSNLSWKSSKDKINKFMNDKEFGNCPINDQLKQNFLNRVKQVLVIINPASGAGRAINVFEKKVVPLLKQSQINFKVMITKKQGSAYKWLRNIAHEDLFELSGIVVVSGDGLLFEVFNSLMSRSDWKNAIKLPVGVIPGGSGNGLSYSISYAVGDTNHNQIIAAAHNIISGKHSPLDLVRVKCDKKTYYAFLSIGWGLLSDIDIESESLRLLGGYRFTIWAVFRTLNLRKYCGELKFKLISGYSVAIETIENEEFKSPAMSNDSDVQLDENDYVKLLNYITRKEERELINDERKHKRLLDGIQEKNDKKEKNCLNTELKGDHSNNSLGSSGTNSSDGDKNDDNNNKTTITTNSFRNNLIESQYKRKNIINNHTKSATDDWITVKGDFVMVYAVSTSHISSDCHFAPGAKLDDGIIWLLFLKGDIGRKEVIKFLFSLEKGNHVRLPYVYLVPVSEFILKSYSSNSKFTVDGELVNTNKVHCKIMPCLARIMTK